MTNPIYLLPLFLLSSLCPAFTQPCLLPDVLITRQSQIDSFSLLHPDCSVLTGDLIIEGEDIQNLLGFAHIDSVLGELTIRNTYFLTDFSGLDQLVYVGKNFNIRNNVGMVDCAGLERLKSIGGSLAIRKNTSLYTLTGFTGLQSLGGGLSIGSNVNLISLEGLSALQTTGRNLILDSLPRIKDLRGLSSIKMLKDMNRIWVLDSLESFDGLNHLEEVRGRLWLRELPKISGFEGFEKLEVVFGALQLSGLPSHPLSGFPSLKTINDELQIFSNEDLADLNWFPALDSIRRKVHIHNNSGLVSLKGLEFLNSAGGLDIGYNTGLLSLYGLQNVKHLYGSLNIIGNADLTDLSNLSGLIGVEGFVSIQQNQALKDLAGLDMINPYTVNELRIVYNDHLTSCSVPFVCDYLGFGGTSTITGNDPGCNTEIEVRQNCFTSYSNSMPSNPITLEWDPLQKEIRIEMSLNELYTWDVIDMAGRILLSGGSHDSNILDLHDFPPGNYAFHVRSSRFHQVMTIAFFY